MTNSRLGRLRYLSALVGAATMTAVAALAAVSPRASAAPAPTALPAVFCPRQVPGYPQGYPADPVPPAQWTPHAGVDVPAGAIAFASPDPDSGIAYTISPAGYSCRAHDTYVANGIDAPQRIAVYAPQDPTPVWNIGADVSTPHQIPLNVLCGWFPALQAWQEEQGFPLGGCGQPRPVPSWEHPQFFPSKDCCDATGVVTVDAGHREPFLVTSGHSDGATVVLLTMNVTQAGQGVDGGGPECAATPGYAASCRANLEQSMLIATDSPYSDIYLGDVPGILAAIRSATQPPARPADQASGSGVGLTVQPAPGTITDHRATPSTRFQAVVTGSCPDGTVPAIAVHSDVTGRDVVPPVLTVLPGDHSQFYVGQVGAATVQARCGTTVVAQAPIDVQADAYVALGDSYASGEGDSPDSVFLPGTHGPSRKTGDSTGCHRSPNGWANTVAALPFLAGQPFDFVACSGAVISDLYDANTGYYQSMGEYEPPQIFSVDSRYTTLATLSIGGNNVGFSDIVAACIEESQLYRSCSKHSGRTYRDAMRNLADLGQGGFDVTIGTSSHETKTLSDVYVDIASRLAPHGILVVAGYPQLFSTDASRYDTADPAGAPPTCYLGNQLVITKANAQWINSLSVRGNQAIADQVAAANSRLARSRPDVQVVLANYDVSFAHHRVCDKASWINGLRLSYRDFLRGGYYYQTSFHPDRKGQAAIANWVDGYAEAAAWNQGHLAAQPLTPGTTSSLLAAGFAPGEQVAASLHSVPVDLGRYRASSSGMVSVPVRIPPGFTPGPHTIVLTGQTSRRSQTFRITVSAGQNRWYPIGALAALAVALTAGAGAAAYRNRRRQLATARRACRWEFDVRR